MVERTIRLLSGKVMAEPGELILLSLTNGSRRPVLGVFANSVQVKRGTTYSSGAFEKKVSADSSYICFAGQVYRLDSVVLPGDYAHANFTKLGKTGVGTCSNLCLDLSRSGQLSGYFQQLYPFTTRTVSHVAVGKEKIIETLENDSKKRFQGHIDIIGALERPYLQDFKLSKKLGIIS